MNVHKLCWKVSFLFVTTCTTHPIKVCPYYIKSRFDILFDPLDSLCTLPFSLRCSSFWVASSMRYWQEDGSENHEEKVSIPLFSSQPVSRLVAVAFLLWSLQILLGSSPLRTTPALSLGSSNCFPLLSLSGLWEVTAQRCFVIRYWLPWPHHCKQVNSHHIYLVWVSPVSPPGLWPKNTKGKSVWVFSIYEFLDPMWKKLAQRYSKPQFLWL